MAALCRDKLFGELKDDILEMAKSKYAHFFVQKMLRYGSKEQRAHIFKVMEGNIAKVKPISGTC
jgi:pumilio family protein 6